MGSDAMALHIAFFPWLSPGHMLPLVDVARVFAQRGVRATIVTTPANAASLRSAIDRTAAAGHPIDLLVAPFPAPELTGLAPGQENLSSVPDGHFHTFLNALSHLRTPVEPLLRDLRPDFIVSDSLFPWTVDLAADLGIPRLTFQPVCAFSLFVFLNLAKYFPLAEDSFTMDALPHRIRVYKAGIPHLLGNIPFMQLVGEAEAKTYGVVLNSCRELEPAYVDHHKGLRRTWCVSPTTFFSRVEEERAAKGGSPVAQTEQDRILAWLGSHPPASVVYVCFGSLCQFSSAQLREIARGLEASGRPFLWVVRRESSADAAAAAEEWMPEGFEGRVAGRGLLLRGWAPQVAVLGHGAVGWFVTHCGWNSIVEALCAGVPMVTWPLMHDHFINQELVLKVMEVGAPMWEGFRSQRLEDENVVVTAEEIAAVLARVTGGGEEVEGMRRRARELGEAARKSTEEGGSTYADIKDLIEHLDAHRKEGRKED